jgi:CRP-like cAMP-binding protein
MYEAILKSLDVIGRFSASDKELFIEKLQVFNYPSNLVLLNEKAICNTILFLNKGAIRQYYLDDEGNEITYNLFTQFEWVLDFESFIGQKPTKMIIKTSDDVEVLALTVTNLHALIARSQVFLQLGKILNEPQRPSLYDFTNSPEEKYTHLLNTKPQYLQAFPLKQVASYLKMTPETLSRVRRKIKNS